MQFAAQPLIRVRILLGFFRPQDAPSYLRSIGADVDQRSLDASHALARDHIARIARRGETSVTPLPEHPHLAELRAEPTFTEVTAGSKSFQFASVEVKKLVACQPKVDWDHVERLMPQVPMVGDEDGLRRFCLPLQRDVLPSKMQPTFNAATKTLSCVVDNLDLRVCGPAQGGQPGTGRSLVGFSIGPGLHQMSVVVFKGHFLLNNGAHRAVALARAGHVRIPVVLMEAPTLDLTPLVRNGMFSPEIALGVAPPRVEDFASAAAVEFTTRRIRLLFSVHAEVHEILD